MLIHSVFPNELNMRRAHFKMYKERTAYELYELNSMNENAGNIMLKAEQSKYKQNSSIQNRCVLRVLSCTGDEHMLINSFWTLVCVISCGRM